MTCFINGSLVTEVLPLSGCLTFPKATNSPGLQTCFWGLYTCAHGAGGPLHEVFCTVNVCTGFAYVFVTGAGPLEGMVVLKGAFNSGSWNAVCNKEFWSEISCWLWLYNACCFCMLSNIWKTFDAVLDAVLDPDFPHSFCWNEAHLFLEQSYPGCSLEWVHPF